MNIRVLYKASILHSKGIANSKLNVTMRSPISLVGSFVQDFMTLMNANSITTEPNMDSGAKCPNLGSSKMNGTKKSTAKDL